VAGVTATSGTFPYGVTAVTCAAADAAGNVGTPVTFTVRVDCLPGFSFQRGACRGALRRTRQRGGSGGGMAGRGMQARPHRAAQGVRESCPFCRTCSPPSFPRHPLPSPRPAPQTTTSVPLALAPFVTPTRIAPTTQTGRAPLLAPARPASTPRQETHASVSDLKAQGEGGGGFGGPLGRVEATLCVRLRPQTRPPPRPPNPLSDVNECAADPNFCAVHASCRNFPGYAECTCDPGYAGDGYPAAKGGAGCSGGGGGGGAAAGGRPQAPQTPGRGRPQQSAAANPFPALPSVTLPRPQTSSRRASTLPAAPPAPRSLPPPRPAPAARSSPSRPCLRLTTSPQQQTSSAPCAAARSPAAPAAPARGSMPSPRVRHWVCPRPSPSAPPSWCAPPRTPPATRAHRSPSPWWSAAALATRWARAPSARVREGARRPLFPSQSLRKRKGAMWAQKRMQFPPTEGNGVRCTKPSAAHLPAGCRPPSARPPLITPHRPFSPLAQTPCRPLSTSPGPFLSPAPSRPTNRLPRLRPSRPGTWRTPSTPARMSPARRPSAPAVRPSPSFLARRPSPTASPW
jgi:hypothetical protein